MPTIDVLRDEAGRPTSLSQDLLCAMIWPDDPEFRASARATFELKDQAAASTREGLLTLRSELVRLVLSGPGLKEVNRRKVDRTLNGQVAGQIVLDLLSAHADGEQPTVAGSTRALLSELGRHTTRGGDPGSISERTIKSAWATYRPVAHFWAASLLALNKLGDSLWPIYMHNEPRAWAAIAMDLLRRAASLRSSNRNGPEPFLSVDDAFVLPQDILLPPVVRAGHECNQHLHG